MSDGLPADDEVARLTDKTNVVGIDASNYGEDVYQYNGTFKVEFLRQAIDIIEMLGWEEINCGSIQDAGTNGARLLLLTPDSKQPWRGEQASIGVAGRLNSEYAEEHYDE